jgi:hypothetical protein
LVPTPGTGLLFVPTVCASVLKRVYQLTALALVVDMKKVAAVDTQ